MEIRLLLDSWHNRSDMRRYSIGLISFPRCLISLPKVVSLDDIVDDRDNWPEGGVYGDIGHASQKDSQYHRNGTEESCTKQEAKTRERTSSDQR